jgi:uncharacterized protein YqhQ
MARHWFFRLPIVRGIIALGESLAIGFRALGDLGELRGAGGGRRVETELSRGAIIFAFAIAIGFAIMLFKVTPALIVNWLPIETTGWFVIVEGLIRVAIFVLYLLIISLLPDLTARLRVPRRRAQGDQRVRGRARSSCRSACSASA